MKQKVLKAIKPLLSSKGLSEQELESLAEIAAKNLTETSTDEEIQNVCNGLIPYADVMQRMSNRMVTAAVKKFEGWVDPKTIEPEPQPQPKPEPQPKPGLTQEEIQKLIADGIAAGLKPFQEANERQRLSSMLNSHEKVKGIPEAFRAHYVLEKEEDLESMATRMESDYTAVKQSLIQSGEFAPAPQGSKTGDTDDLIERLHQMASGAN